MSSRHALRQNYLEILDQLTLEAGGFSVVDRGYIDVKCLYKRWATGFSEQYIDFDSKGSADAFTELISSSRNAGRILWSVARSQQLKVHDALVHNEQHDKG